MTPGRPRLVALALLAAAALVSAQQPSQQPTFRTRIDAVTVDAAVTDERGRPVTDLTIDDFEIKENGKVQKIESFKLFGLNDAAPSRPSVAITSLDVQEREAARDDVRLIAILLDDYHTQVGSAMSVRENVAKFVAGLDPKDLVAVMYPLTPSTALTFSRNHEGTARAIMEFQGRKYNYIPKYPQEEVYHYLDPPAIEQLRNRVVIDALAGLCTVMGGFRDGRKSVIFVSEGLNSWWPPELLSRNARVGLSAPTGPNPALDKARFQAQIELLDRMKDIFVAARRANTALYPLDPRGLAVFESSMASPVSLSTDRQFLTESLDSLHILADNTDGRPIVDTNDPSSGLRQILIDSGSYYLLGFTSTESSSDGKFHAIEVKVKRKGLEVRARKGYWAPSAEDVARARAPEAPPLPAALTAALASAAAPPPGRTLRTWIGFDRADDGRRTMVTVVWEATQAASADPAGRATITMTTPNGDLVFRGRSPRDPQLAGGRVTFPAAPGAVHVRIAAEGETGRPVDTDERDVTIPDFTRAGPAISTPAVYRARTARDLAQIKASETAVPSAVARFARTEFALLRFRAFGPGGTTPAVHARLVNSRGDVLMALADPERRPDGSFNLPISVASLVPGTYAVEIEAVSDAERARVYCGFSIGN